MTVMATSAARRTTAITNCRRSLPKTSHAATKSAAVVASTNGYRQGIGAAHARQRPRNTRNDTSGMLSCQAMALPHPGHVEPGIQRLRRSGTRAITTFKKLPITRPKVTTGTRAISGGEVMCERPRQFRVQLPEDVVVLSRLRVVAALEVAAHEADPWLRRVGIERGRTMELLDGVPELAGAGQGHAVVRAGQHIVRLQHERPSRVRDGLIELRLSYECDGKVVQDGDIDAVRRDGPLQVSLRLRGPIELDESQPDAGVRLVAVWSQGQGPSKVHDGRFGIALIHEVRADIVVADRALRFGHRRVHPK